MKDTAWRIAAYAGWGGIFVLLFGPNDTIRSHGQRGCFIFAVEILALVIADIIRLQFGWSKAAVFGLWLAGVAAAATVMIIKAARPCGDVYTAGAG